MLQITEEIFFFEQRRWRRPTIEGEIILRTTRLAAFKADYLLMKTNWKPCLWIGTGWFWIPKFEKYDPTQLTTTRTDTEASKYEPDHLSLPMTGPKKSKPCFWIYDFRKAYPSCRFSGIAELRQSIRIILRKNGCPQRQSIVSMLVDDAIAGQPSPKSDTEWTENGFMWKMPFVVRAQEHLVEKLIDDAREMGHDMLFRYPAFLKGARICSIQTGISRNFAP